VVIILDKVIDLGCSFCYSYTCRGLNECEQEKYISKDMVNPYGYDGYNGYGVDAYGYDWL